MTQLLTEVIFFVAYEENTGNDPLDVKSTKVDRERQKLVREQNILKQVSVRRPPASCLLLRQSWYCDVIALQITFSGRVVVVFKGCTTIVKSTSINAIELNCFAKNVSKSILIVNVFKVTR